MRKQEETAGGLWHSCDNQQAGVLQQQQNAPHHAPPEKPAMIPKISSGFLQCTFLLLPQCVVLSRRLAEADWQQRLAASTMF